MKISYEHPGNRKYAVLLDTGNVVPAAEADANGYEVKRWPYRPGKGTPMTATRHPYDTELVVVQHGVTMGALEAELLGYTLSDTVVPKIEPRSPHQAWRAAILTSLEAKDRPDATAELVMAHTEATMPVETARAFLRGLPTEHPDDTEETMTTNDDPRAARLAEITQSAASFNKSKGYAAKEQPSLAAGKVDPTKLKRLAELRLSALTMRIAQGDNAVSKEHRNLQYAMSVHNQTGAPLATVFTQLGVDTTAMLRNVR